jgi:arylsulfate sulfotransferase
MRPGTFDIALGVAVMSAVGLFLSSCGASSAPGDPVSSVLATQNPLVAQYNVAAAAPETAWVEFGTTTAYGRQTSVVQATDENQGQISVLVAGMKPNTTYHMRAHATYYGGFEWVDHDQTFTTGGLPPGNKLGLKVTRPNPGLNVMQDGVELLDIEAPQTNNLEAAVTDLDGNVIWYYSFGPNNPAYPFPIRPLPDGNMLINAGFATSDILEEIDLAGNVIKQIDIPGLNQRLQAADFPDNVININHDVLPLANGHWIVLTQTSKSFTDLPGYPGTTNVLGDYLIDLDPNFNPVWVWSDFDHFDVNRHPVGLPDWTHGNAIVYSPNDGNLLFSMRNQNWVIKIDYENGAGSGDVLWRLGEGGDFALTGGDPSQWFYVQHFPYLISQNDDDITLAIFDDGGLRPNSLGESCYGFYPACYTRGVIIDADESKKIASVKWEYLPGLYTLWGGSIDTLDNGDVELDVTAPYYLKPESLVFEVTQTENPQIAWQLQINGGFAYRAYRIPSLYPGVTWH